MKICVPEADIEGKDMWLKPKVFVWCKHMFGAKLISKPTMITSHQSHLKERTSMKNVETNQFLLNKRSFP